MQLVSRPILSLATMKQRPIDELGNPVDISRQSKLESPYETETKGLKDFSDFTLIPKPEEDKKDLDISKLRVKTAEEFLYGDRPRELSISQAPEQEYSLIESGIKKLANILGFESPLAKDKGITDAAKAQALIQHMTSEEGIPVSEFRNSPEFIEKFAQGFTDVASFGILPALKEVTTGETEFAPDSFMGYAGKGLGSFAGLLFGPAKAGELIASPITSRIAVTRDMPLAVRVLKQGLKEALILSPTIGASVFGEALQEKSFGEAAGTIVSGLESGALTGAIFGVSRGLFPQEVRHRAARIIAGLVGLNAQRALENPGINVWDRPTHEVIFDTAMDVFFMWRGLPRREFTEFERLTDKMLRDEELTPGEFDSIIAELHRLKKEASRENNKEVENILKTKKTSPPKPKTEMRPAEVDPDYTFTSQKGNYYEKVGDKWYDQKGIEVTNKYVIAAAERSKVEFGIGEDAASDALIAELEARYKKGIDDITDKEIEDYIIERETKAEERGEVEKEPTTDLDLQIKADNYFDTSTTDMSYYDNLLKKGEAEIVYMTPDEYFDQGAELLSDFAKIQEQYTPEFIKKYGRPKTKAGYLKTLMNEDLISEYANRLKSGEKAPMPVLDTIENAQEGRHRALAAKEAGIEQIPVVVRKGKVTGEEIPETSFRQPDKEVTKHQLKSLPTYERIDNIDSLMARMETEVNAWLDGESIDIASTKKLIDQLADNSKLWAEGSESPPGIFSEMTFAEMENFADYMQKLNSWARRTKRGEGDWYSSEPGTKLYDIGGATTEGIKQIFDKLTGRNKTKVNSQPPDPFQGVREEGREAVRTRVGKLNVANYDTNKFVNLIEQRITKDQQDIMMFVIEKTDIPDELGRPDLQKALKRDRKYLEPIAEEIKDHFETGFLKVKKHLKDLSAKQIRDYVTHIWDIPVHEQAEAIRWFSTQDRFMQRRFIDTYADGIKRGFKPKTLNINEIIKIHDAVGNRAIENVRYINAMLEMERDGIKLLTRNPEEAPAEWIEVNYPALTRRVPLSKTQIKRKGSFVKEAAVYAHPDLVRPLKVIFEQRFDHPVISAYEAINGIMKQAWFTASFFHHFVLTQSAIALIGPVQTAKILNPVNLYRALIQEKYPIFEKEAIARDAIENALVQFGATSDIPAGKIQGYLDSLARNTKDITMVNRMTSAFAGGYSLWNKALWDYLHDSFKLYGYEKLVSKIDPKLNAEDTLKHKREIGRIVNDTFGGQIWESLMISPKEIQMMTWSLLSTDWTYSTTRQALGLAGVGRIYKETRWLRAKKFAGYWFRAGLYFYVGMNLLNALFRKWDMEENPQYYGDKEYSFMDKTMLGNTVGKKTRLFVGRYNDGSEKYYKFDKQFSDFFELFTKFPEKIGGKAAPIPQGIAQFFTGHTLSGFKNDDVYGAEGLDKAIGIAKLAVKSFTPISIQRFLRDNIDIHPFDIAMQSSKGLSRYNAMEYFKKAIVTGDEEMFRDVYVGALRNNLPAYTLFTSALGWAEGELIAEVAKDVDSLEDAKLRLAAATSAYDKRRWGKIVAKLSKEKADKESGLTRLRSALERANSYKDLAVDKSELHKEYGR